MTLHAPQAKSRPWRRLAQLGGNCGLGAGLATANGGIRYEVVPVFGQSVLSTRIKTATNGGTLDVVFVGPDFDPSGTTAFANATLNPAGANNSVKYMARVGGFDGERISVAYVDPAGANKVLTVTVTGRAISVSLATDGSSVITSTAALVRAAILASADANALIESANAGGDDGTGVVTAIAATSLGVLFTDLVGTKYTTGNPAQVPVVAGTEALIQAICLGDGYAIIKFTGTVGAGSITYCDIAMADAPVLSAASVTLATGDIEIGAVELKNGTDDTRAKIGTSSAIVSSDNGVAVAVAAIAAAETHIGEVSTPILAPSANFTRPADTTAYASGDLVANSVTAGSVVAMALAAARVAAGAFAVRRVRLKKSNTSLTNASFRVHFYDSDPTAASGITNGDNGAWLTKIAGYLGSCDITMDKAFSDAAAGQAAPAVGSEMSAKLASGTTLYALLEARAAYTPASAEVFTLVAEVFPA